MFGEKVVMAKKAAPLMALRNSGFRFKVVGGGDLLEIVPVVSDSGYKLVKLASGVFSVHSLAHRETFHPVVGPVAEAEALYVRQLRLLERLERHEGEFV